MTVEPTSSRNVIYRPPPDPALLPQALLEKCAKLDAQLPTAFTPPIDQVVGHLIQEGSPSQLLAPYLPRIQHPLSSKVVESAHHYGARWGRSISEQPLVTHGQRIIAFTNSNSHSFIRKLEALATAVNNTPTRIRDHTSRTKPDGMGRSLTFPPPHVMKEGILNLKDWLRLHQNTPAVLQAAIACQILLGCHPLPDGNGRAARIIANALLISRGNMPETTYIPLNEMFILALGGMDLRSRAVDLYGRWHSWIGWFCDVVETSLISSPALTLQST